MDAKSASPAAQAKLSTGKPMAAARLKELYMLFGETLHQLCHIGLALDKDPGIVI